MLVCRVLKFHLEKFVNNKDLEALRCRLAFGGKEGVRFATNVNARVTNDCTLGTRPGLKSCTKVFGGCLTG